MDTAALSSLTHLPSKSWWPRAGHLTQGQLPDGQGGCRWPELRTLFNRKAVTDSPTNFPPRAAGTPQSAGNGTVKKRHTEADIMRQRKKPRVDRGMLEEGVCRAELSGI